MNKLFKKDNFGGTLLSLVRVLVFLLLATGAMSCVDPLEFDSLTDDVEDLCASDAAFSAAMQQCEQEGCEGVFSARGTILSIPIAFTDKNIKMSAVDLVQFVQGGAEVTTVVDKLELSAHSIFGNFIMEFKDLDEVPVEVEDSIMVPGLLASGMERTADGVLRASIRINNGTESTNVHAVINTGEMRLSVASAQKVVGTFEIAYETPDDVLTGCFVVFPGEVTMEHETLPTR